MKWLRHAGGYIRGERGMALVITLMMLVLLTLLGFAAITMSTTDVKIAGNEKVSIQAQYAAEAGIADGIRWLNANLASIPQAPYAAGNYNPWTPAPITGSAGGYNYTVNISLKPDTGDIDRPDPAHPRNPDPTPIILYQYSFGYTKAPHNNPFPVIVVKSTATSPGGYNSIVELEVTRFIIPVNNSIQGGITSNGSITLTGNISVSGYNYDVNGNTYTGYTTVAAGALPGTTSDGTVNVTGSGSSTGTVPTISNDTKPPIKSIADALGMSESDGATFFASSGVTNFTAPAGPSPADYAAGGVFYVQVPAGTSWSSLLSGGGLLIVHNPLYVPQAWRVSNDPTSPNYDHTHTPPSAGGYYDAGLDPSSGSYNAGYAASCKPSNLGNVNAGSNFKGVIIADQINKINGTATIIGAVIALDSIVGDVDKLDGTGTIKYSSAAVSQYASNTNNVSTKLAWKKMSAY